VKGTIYNDGPISSGGMIHLRILANGNLHDYDVPTGVVPKEKSIPFTWAQEISSDTLTGVQLLYSVTTDYS
jgi:hypothetical protein